VDQASQTTELSLWAPPCYLTIPSFSKKQQDTTVDSLKTKISYNVELAHFGDDACSSLAAKITMASADGTTTFSHWLDQSDIASAL